MTRILRLSLVSIILVMLAVTTGNGYVYSGHRWKVSPVPYYVNPTNKDLPQAAALKAVQWAADAWSNQTRAAIRFEYAGGTSATSASNNGRSEVMFRDAIHPNRAIGAVYRYWDGSGYLTNVDTIFYDADYTFYAYTSNTGCVSDKKGHYVEAIGIHEFGHAIGLGHSSVSGATMIAGATRCATWKMSLHADDIAGAESIYGTIAEPEPDPAPTPGVQGTLTNKTPEVRFAIVWTGLSGASVEIYVNGVLYQNQTTPNDGSQTIVQKNAGPWQVKVCAVGGTTCTPTITVSL